MNFIQKIASFFQQKSNQTINLLLGRSKYEPNRDLRALALEGYIYCAIAYSCIDKIASACSEIKIDYGSLDREGKFAIKTNTELERLFKKPNITQNYRRFIYELVSSYLVFGSAYLNGFLGNGKQIFQMEILDPHLMTIDTTSSNFYFPRSFRYQPDYGMAPREYVTNLANGEIIWTSEIGFKSKLLYIKGYNPIDRYRGLSKLDVSALNIDLHNNGMEWNNATIANSGMPAGILRTDQGLHDNQFDRLQKDIKENWSAVKKGRGIQILDGGLDFKQLSLSPVDMDYKNQLEEAAKQIGMVYKVPWPLIIAEASTYNNRKTAYEEFYEICVIPLMNELFEYLLAFLETSYPNQTGQINEDSISALEDKRNRKFERMIKAKTNSIISINEARIELGFEERPEPEADEILIPANQVPLSLASIDEALNNIQDPANNQNNGDNQNGQN